MNSRRLPYLPCSFHPRGLDFARKPDTTLLAMHATAILHLACSHDALLRDDRRSILVISTSAHTRGALRSFELEEPAGVIGPKAAMELEAHSSAHASLRSRN